MTSRINSVGREESILVEGAGEAENEVKRSRVCRDAK